jgi:hypothetical protein
VKCFNETRATGARRAIPLPVRQNGVVSKKERIMGIDMFSDKFTQVVKCLLTVIGIGNSSFIHVGGRESVVAGGDVTAKFGIGLEVTAGADTKIGAQHTFISGSLLRGNSVENHISGISNRVDTLTNTVSAASNRAVQATNQVTAFSANVAGLRTRVANIEEIVTQAKMDNIANDLRACGTSVRMLGECIETIVTDTRTVNQFVSAANVEVDSVTMATHLAQVVNNVNGMTVFT